MEVKNYYKTIGKPYHLIKRKGMVLLKSSATCLLFFNFLNPASSFELKANDVVIQQQDEITITGVVRDQQKNEAVIGVTIKSKGKVLGVTDVNGRFNIKANPNARVSFESLGYSNETRTFATAQNDVVISLIESLEEIQEVIVTALGIKREEKSLGYSVSKISNEELTKTVSNNWLSSMQGKVPGLVLDQASSGPGGSMRMTLRGDQSLNYDNNEALLVIDGVPISSGTTGTSSVASYSNNDSPADFGNAASELNPEDIESVSVLKGPSATALYGSRAANGAIVITTKSGRSVKGFGVTVNSSVSFEQAGYFPDFQKEYGAGNGNDTYSMWDIPANLSDNGLEIERKYSRYAFGEKFEPGEMRYLYTSRDWETGEYTKKPWEYADNWYTGLFETGALFNNTVSIDGNTGKGTSVRLSFTDTQNEWIVPNSGYTKQNVSLSLTQEINEFITINSRVNYYKRKSDNTPKSGYNSSSPMYSLIWAQNVNDIEDTWKTEYDLGRFNRDVYEAGGEDGLGLVYPSANTYNPYRTLNEELNKLDRDRVFGNLGVTFNLLENLQLSVRSGLDFNNEFRTQQKPKFSSGFLYGFYREQNITDYEMNNDFMLRYDHDFLNDDLTASFTFGGNNMVQRYNRKNVSLDRLDVDDFYSLSNIASGFPPIPAAFRSQKVVNSLYGLAQLGWKNLLFVDVTGRNDWSSTLAKQNNSYFYPSVSMSLLLDQALDIKSRAEWVDMLKLRASWANVGNDTDPYALDQYYSRTDFSGGYWLPTTIPDPMIQPENIQSWETGIDGRFFKGRLSLDVALYSTSTTNQIISSTTDMMSGASSMRINVGEISNKGIEVATTFSPIKRQDGFQWNIALNWSKNWNKLVSLADDWDLSQPLQTSMGTTIGGRTYINSFVGEEMHVIYGKGYQKAPEGSTYTDANGNVVDLSGRDIVNPKTGYPVLDSAPETRIGKVNPDWRAGMMHNFKYKNLSLGLTFSGQLGGNTYSVTNFALSYQGKLKNSLPGREEGFLVHEGVNKVEDADGNITYVPNEAQTNDIREYYNKYVWVRDNTENNTFSTSFLKLKEVRFDYSLPEKYLQKVNFLQDASIGIFGTNLFMLTNFPQYDPEAGMLSGTSIYKGIESGSFPMTRTYGMNIRVNF